ncbi:MAG: SMP-30/gluconolactonase/LRE family protein [Sandaracinus sp.]|nr:SMP-30/gluconolactonase/LRE family protein [Sandaracinus sp.]MCB9633221.1 SMP-30/gluconolactonase/LRE family protein [Sandaracinus sp.]
MRRLLFVLLAACGSSGGVDAPDGGLEDDAALVGADASAGDASIEDDAGAEGLDRYPLEARFPEGGSYDPAEGAFYVGSLGDGSVHRVDRRTGEETVFFEETAPGTWWTLGMHVDVERRRLFVCAMDDQRETTEEEPPYLGYVWELDLPTGRRLATHDLSDAHPRATCTDVTVTSDGVAWVSDREHPNVYRIADGEVTLFATDDALEGGLVGLNALVATPDESALLAIVYLPSRLVRIDLGTREVVDVEIDGGFLDATPALSGADGMAWGADGRLLVAFTSELTTLEAVTADWRAVRSESVDVAEGMTDVVVADGVPYLLNGQAVRFAFDRDPDPFALVRFTGR